MTPITAAHRALSSAALAAALLMSTAVDATARTDNDDPSVPAESPSGGDHDPASIVIAYSEEEQRAALDYWTAERTQAAVGSDPLYAPADGDPPATELDTENDDAGPQRVDPTGPTALPSAGWLLYRANGRDYHCSANAVPALNRSVVATAGHCVITPPDYRQAQITHLVFLLGYRNNQAVGRYPARFAHLVRGWTQRGEVGFDFAFISVGRDTDHLRPGDRTALAPPLRFSAPPTEGLFQLYGYPSAIANGQALMRCSDHGQPMPYANAGPRLRIVPNCPDFNYGASGGPVVQIFPEGAFQTGNISLYGEQTQTVGVTYWEAAAHGAWDAAQRD